MDGHFPSAPRVKRPHLLAAGVGAVICGDFVAWQPANGQGFGCALVSFFVAAMFYLVLLCTLAEVVSRMGYAEGPSQVAACIGPRTSFIAGFAEVLKCVFVMADVATAIGAFMQEIFLTPSQLQPIWWVAFSVVTLLLNTMFFDVSMKALVVLTGAACSILLALFFLSLSTTFDFAHDVVAGVDPFRRVSLAHMVQVMPAGLWFFLGVEELFWFGKFAKDMHHSMPRAMTWSYVMLFVLSCLALLVGATSSQGSHSMMEHKFPLLDAYVTALGESDAVRYLCVCLVLGFVASLHTFTFVAGQLMTQMAEDNQLPACLAYRSKVTGAPTISALIATLLALVLAEVIFQAEEYNYEALRGTFISAATLCAVFVYIIELVCFFLLRRGSTGNEEKVFTSPFGVPGAVIALGLSLVFFTCTVVSPFVFSMRVSGMLISLSGLLLAGLFDAVTRCRKRIVRAADVAAPKMSRRPES
ncbi:unnamed protein product [Effrenium voratum]|uniref:Uncharacterized protein n=1 Tax=Effrenium voratum TaxID=2562239 RepID=A0AA36ISK5_9DINO|nr:unnamed protein product [Effrenium voratum]